MPKINIEDYLEESQQSRYFYGRISMDKMCTNCGAIMTLDEFSSQEPCQHCGEWAGLIDIE